MFSRIMTRSKNKLVSNDLKEMKNNLAHIGLFGGGELTEKSVGVIHSLADIDNTQTVDETHFGKSERKP